MEHAPDAGRTEQVTALRRKTKKVMWLVFYHGPASTVITMDLQAAWNNKKAALAAIARDKDPRFYSVEKYVRGGER